MLLLANPDGYAYTHSNVRHYHEVETWFSDNVILMLYLTCEMDFHVSEPHCRYIVLIFTVAHKKIIQMLDLAFASITVLDCFNCVMYRTVCGVRPAPRTQALRAVELIPTGTGMQALVVSIEKSY